MRRTFITSGILVLAASCMVSCNKQPTPAPSTASPQVVAELKADMEQRDSLMHDRVIGLLKTKAGQDALAELADEYDKLFYNGHKRFAIIAPISTGQSEHAVGLTLSEGEQDLAFPISYVIRLLNATMDDQFEIEFKSNSVTVTMKSEGEKTKSVDISWPQGTLGPHGFYNFETGETNLDQ